MENKEAFLTDVVADMSRRNEYLERELADLKIELYQTKAMLQACRSRSMELNDSYDKGN